jgi:hypothetical protein
VSNRAWRVGRRVVMVATLVLLAGQGSRAADTLKGGCGDDVRRFCAGQPTGPTAQQQGNPVRQQAQLANQRSCLRQYWVSLSPGCRKTMRPPAGDDGDTDE